MSRSRLGSGGIYRSIRRTEWTSVVGVCIFADGMLTEGLVGRERMGCCMARIKASVGSRDEDLVKKKSREVVEGSILTAAQRMLSQPWFPQPSAEFVRTWSFWHMSVWVQNFIQSEFAKDLFSDTRLGQSQSHQRLKKLCRPS